MRVFLSISILYVVVGMLSNISSLRIINILGISMDAGTLLYPLTFTLRDLIHKKSDKKTNQNQKTTAKEISPFNNFEK